MVNVANMSARVGLGKPNRWTYQSLSRRFRSSLTLYEQLLKSISRTDFLFYIATLRKEEKKPFHGFYKRLVETIRFPQHDASRRVVVTAVVGSPWVVRVRRLF